MEITAWLCDIKSCPGEGWRSSQHRDCKPTAFGQGCAKWKRWTEDFLISLLDVKKNMSSNPNHSEDSSPPHLIIGYSTALRPNSI